jgi:hypothetical protein
MGQNVQSELSPQKAQFNRVTMFYESYMYLLFDVVEALDVLIA